MEFYCKYPQFKIIIIGDVFTGKTSILKRYCHNVFDLNYKCSIGVQFKLKLIKIRNKEIRLQLWDIAGQKRFQEMTKSYYRQADACIIVYDITNKESFDNVPNWFEQLQQNVNSDQIAVVLLGNKKDLWNLRNVEKQEAFEYANQNGMYFDECSAKNEPQTIYNIFETLAEKLLEIQERREKHQVIERKQSIGYEKIVKLYSPPEEKKGCCK